MVLVLVCHVPANCYCKTPSIDLKAAQHHSLIVIISLFQIFHMCDEDGRRIPYMCANETSFNQKFRVCDWNYNVDCASSPDWWEWKFVEKIIATNKIHVFSGISSTIWPTELILPRAAQSHTMWGGGRVTGVRENLKLASETKLTRSVMMMMMMMILIYHSLVTNEDRIIISSGQYRAY